MIGKTAFVTGAASGLGAAVVEAALAVDYLVTAVDIDGKAVTDRWGAAARVTPVQADVRKGDHIRAAFAAGDVPTLVVNSAGIGRRALIQDLTDEDWDAVLSVNLTGTMIVCREAIRIVNAGAVIMNIASIAGHRSFAGRAAYCASKAGVIAFTEVLALECAMNNVRALAISPGYVRTPMAVAQEGFVDDGLILSRVPVGRLGDPSEIGRAVVALAGDEFSFLTGTTVVIDGGWCANGGFWPVPALEAARRQAMED